MSGVPSLAIVSNLNKSQFSLTDLVKCDLFIVTLRHISEMHQHNFFVGDALTCTYLSIQNPTKCLAAVSDT